MSEPASNRAADDDHRLDEDAGGGRVHTAHAGEGAGTMARTDASLEFEVIGLAADSWIITVSVGGVPPSPLVGVYACEGSASKSLPFIRKRWRESFGPDVSALRSRLL